MKFGLIISFLLITLTGWAQKSQLTGTLHFPDGRPASFAVVYIEKSKIYATSDDDGNWRMDKVPYGSHILEVKTIEAEPFSLPIQVKSPTLSIPITLEESKDFRLDDVVIMGKTEERKMKELGFAVGMVETNKASIQSLQTTDLLDRTAGIRIRQSGGMGSDTQFNINGLTGNSVRIFIDGVLIRNFGNSFSLSSIPPALIERIEVYKGVVPTHLAEDALGGAINVVMKKSSSNNLSASYSFGSFNTHQANVNGHYRNNKTGFTVGGGAFYNYTDNDYKVWGDQVYVVEDPTTSGRMSYVTARRFHDSFQSMGVNADIGFTGLKWADRLTAGVVVSDMDKDIQHGATMEVVYGNRRSETVSQMVNLKYEKMNIFDRLSVNLYGSYSHANRTVIDTIADIYNWNGVVLTDRNGDPFQWNKGGGEAGNATHAKNIEKMFAGRGSLDYKINNNNRVAVNYLFNHFSRDVDDPYLTELERELSDTRYLTKGILGVSYNNSLFNDRLKSSFFYKYYTQKVELKDFYIENNETLSEVVNRTTRESGYGAAFSFEIVPRVMLMLSGEKALRMPESTEILGNTSQNIESSYDLRPEESINLNIGLNLGTFKMKDHWLGLDVNFFYRDISNMITRKVSNNTATDMTSYENLGKVLSKGVDVELKYGYKDMISFITNLSNFNARFNQRYDENGNEYSYYRNRLRNAPYFTWNNALEVSFDDFLLKGSRITLSYYFNYVHQFFRNWETFGGAGKAIIPTQAVHDCGVSYSFPGRKLTLSFDGRNITNEQVFDNWALQKPGRAFYGKVSYRIF